MASSHSGEDLHVRTLQAMYRRLGDPAVACSRRGTEGMPLDALTAARLARDGERPARPPHVLRAALGVHPARQARRLGARDLLAGRPPGPGRLPGGGRARRSRADPAARDRHRRLRDPDLRVPAARGRPGVRDPRRPGRRSRRRPAHGAGAATYARSATRCSPTRSSSAGPRDRLDTSLMKAAAGRVVSKSGMEALRGVGILRGARGDGDARRPGSRSRSRTATATSAGPGPRPSRRSARRASLEGQALRVLARYHRPPASIRTGGVAGEAIPTFELAPVGELAGLTPATTMDLPGRPVPDPRHRAGRVAQRDPVGVPAAREAVPPRRGRRARAAAVPRDPGGVRAARRRRGPAATAPAAPARRPPRVRGVAGRCDAGPGVARGLAGAPGRRDGGRRARRDGRHGTEGAARDGRHGRPAGGRPAAPAPRATRRRGERHAPPGLPQGDAGLHDLRRGQGDRRSTRSGTAARGTARRSGTYWTINPREYADPRKHGPEYLARARRAVPAWPATDRRRRRRSPTDELGDGDAADADRARAGRWAWQRARRRPTAAPRLGHARLGLRGGPRPGRGDRTPGGRRRAARPAPRTRTAADGRAAARPRGPAAQGVAAQPARARAARPGCAGGWSSRCSAGRPSRTPSGRSISTLTGCARSPRRARSRCRCSRSRSSR